MKNIIIVEDEIDAASVLDSFVSRYGEEIGEIYNITKYNDAASFLAAYKSADIVFMDIDLPGMNGMNAAKLLRDKDSKVMIIFVTNLSQMAIKGYEVRAFDFIVKPISYKNFSVKFQCALDALRSRQSKDIWITNKDGKKRIDVNEIIYIETWRHILVFHTISGSIHATGTLATLEAELQDRSFAMCNRCYLVNLAFVTAVKQQTVCLGETELLISRTKRPSFLAKLNDFIAMSGGGYSL